MVTLECLALLALGLGAQADPAGPGPGTPQEDRGTILREDVPEEAFRKTRPLIDLDHLEVGLRVSRLRFSGDFEADAERGGGVRLHAPLPALSLELGDHSEGALGIFSDLTFSSIERTLVPAVPDPEGDVVMVGAGLDVTVYRDATWLLRVQAGVQYVSFGDVTGIDDGAAFHPGLQCGVQLFGHATLTFEPEISLGGGGDTVVLYNTGLLIRF